MSSKRPSEADPVFVPLVVRLGGGTSKGPPKDPLVIDLEKVGESFDRASRVSEKPIETVQKVLRRVICRIADERLRIDDKPWFTLR
jgi:hypothetical protein